LADLQSSIEKRAEQWLKSNQAQQLINIKCVTWFNSKIQPELAEETDPICRKFQIPRSSLRFEDGIDPTVVNPQLSLGTISLPLQWLYSQSGDCWGMIGSIIALLLTGHFLAHTGIWCSFLGEGVRLNRESIEDAIKEQVDIPSWIRPISLGNRKIDSMCEKMNPELESGLKQMTQGRLLKN